MYMIPTVKNMLIIIIIIIIILIIIIIIIIIITNRSVKFSFPRMLYNLYSLLLKMTA